MPARRMRVAREREPPDDRPPSSATKTAASGWRWIVRRYRRSSADRAPWPGPEDPAALLAADALREVDERVRVARRGVAGRLSSRRRSRRRRAADRPRPRGCRPPSRCDRLHAAEEEVERVPAVDVPARRERRDVGVRPAALEMQRRALDVEPRRADRVRERACRAGSARSPARSLRRAAPSRRCRSRARGRPAVEHERRRHHAREAIARRLLVRRRSRRARRACC